MGRIHFEKHVKVSKKEGVKEMLEMTKPTNATSVEDQFLDEHLLVVTIKTPWYADVANYLAVGKLPKHLTPNE